MTVITRFAPSPTGFLHIGGARTALFNWLFARHHNGQFLLRIEDTDRQRSTQEAIDAILEGMDWLDLKPDQPPVFQSERADRHREVAEALIESGKAYRCYITTEELSARRTEGQELLDEIRNNVYADEELEQVKARANELLAPFRSPHREGPPLDAASRPFTVRLRAPDEGRISIQDDVQGEVSINASEIDDLILLRADGTPTYMLAVVVDDHDMGVTQIIRGDDHLTNTFRQLPIYQAMDWDAPGFAHIPLIHGPDGKKLSKRHGALAVQEYRSMGYLPEGIKNYLLRLGWSHGDDEFITESQAIDWFNLAGINKGAARMDFEKLGYINAQHMKNVPSERLGDLVLDHLSKHDELSVEKQARVRSALPVLVERGQTIPEIAEATQFLLINRPVPITGKARKKLNPETLERLSELKSYLQAIEDWSAQQLADELVTFCEMKGLSIGQIGPGLRTALTGGLAAPDINLVLLWLGRSEVIGRLDDVLCGESTKE